MNSIYCDVLKLHNWNQEVQNDLERIFVSAYFRFRGAFELLNL